MSCFEPLAVANELSQKNDESHSMYNFCAGFLCYGEFCFKWKHLPNPEQIDRQILNVRDAKNAIKAEKENQTAQQQRCLADRLGVNR